MRWFKSFVTALGAVVTLVGAAGFFLPFILETAFKNDNTIELPLAAVTDVAVSPDGGVYFALMHAGRVQRYTAAGRFVSSFPVDSAGGLLCIATVDETLQVHVARRSATDVHNLDGRLLRENAAEDTGIEYAPCESDPQVAGMTTTWRSVQVRFTGGRPPLTLERRTWHLLALHPFQSWLTFAIGLFMMAWWREGVLQMMGFGRKKQ
jgi:hypothetical protein